mgnify:CR=1 FL=1
MNTTAPHTLRKRLLTLILSFAFLLTCLPAALAVDLNVDAGFYFKQSRGGTCTLASAAMMLRRRAYFDGLTDWTNVTENSVRSTAWANGLAHSFTYKEMQVGYATLPSSLQSKTAVLISLLEQHPEGIVLYDRTQPHAVLLTDYTNGIFYCSDPAGNIGYGRIPITSSSVSIARSSCYWYVTADHNSVAAQADGLRLEGMRYPVNLRTGSGMTLTGTANSATGTTLTSVQVAVLDAADQTVQRASGGTGECRRFLSEHAGQPDPLRGAAGGQLHLYGAGDGLCGREPVLCIGLHGVRQCKQYPDLLVAQGRRGHQAAADGPAGGDHGRDRRRDHRKLVCTAVRLIKI